MYRALFIAAFILRFTVQAIAQIPDIEWQYSANTNPIDNVVTLTQTSDGSILLACKESSDGLYYYYTLRKISSDGNFVWSMDLTSNYGMPDMIKPIELKDGNYLMRSDSQTALKINASTGAIMKTYQNFMSVIGYAQLANGQIGVIHGAFDTDSDYGLTLLNEDFTQVWDKSYNYGQSELVAAIATSVGGEHFVLAGNTSATPGGPGTGWVVAVDVTGTQLWDTPITESITTMFLNPSKLNNSYPYTPNSVIKKQDISRYTSWNDYLYIGTSAGKSAILQDDMVKFTGTIRSVSTTQEGKYVVALSDSIELLTENMSRIWKTNTYAGLGVEVANDGTFLIYGGPDFHVMKTKNRPLVTSDYFALTGGRSTQDTYALQATYEFGSLTDLDGNGTLDFYLMHRGESAIVTDDYTYNYRLLSAYLTQTNGNYTIKLNSASEATQLNITQSNNFKLDDFDNDGQIELFNNKIQNLNTVTGVQAEQPTNLPVINGSQYNSLQWADFDNNGLTDVFINNDAIYLQTSANVFSRLSSSSAFAGTIFAPILVDLNNDGFVDIIDRQAKFIYLNNQNQTFTKQAAPMTYIPSFAIELNGDGLIDFIGYDQSGYSITGYYTFVNNGNNTFTYKALGLSGPSLIGDINNDGKSDIAAYSAYGYTVCFNDGAGNFNPGTNYDYMLPAYYGSSPLVLPGDIDNDNDLDLVTMDPYQLSFVRNNQPTTNLPPGPPSGSTSSRVGNVVTLNWNSSTDDSTPVAALTYNVYIKNGAQIIVSANSIPASGKRMLINSGNAGLARLFKIVGLPVGTYQWSVQAVDKSFQSSAFMTEQTFYITNNPTNITLSNATIPENSAAVIGTLTTTDPDAGETFTYSLVSGTGSTDNASFKITGNAVSTTSAGGLDFETKSAYSIRIRATDSRQGTFEKVFAITATNVQEAATDILLTSATIQENQPAGTLIGILSDNDPDAGDTHTYTLVAGTGSTDNTSFQIAGSSLKSNAAFNFELKASYSIRIQTIDQSGKLFQKAFTITVTDVNDLAKPVINTPTGFTQSGFTLGWAVIEGATSYEIELSTDDFATLTTGYNPAIINTTSLVVINLAAGTTYKVRIRAVESGYKSAYSDPVTQVTIPPNPAAQEPSQVDVTSFKANWSQSTGASGYELEVSVGSGTFIPMASYNPKVVTGFDDVVTGLTQNTVYKYRVRAVNSAGKSGNSNEKSVQTIVPGNTKPIAQPTNLQFTAIATTQFSVSFTAAVGSPDGYLVLVNNADFSTDSPVDGVSYTAGGNIGTSTVGYSGTSTSFTLTGLNPDTFYFLDIFSYKESAGSRSYLTTFPLQGSRTTLALLPANQPSGLSFTGITVSAANGSFSEAAGSPAGYLVIRKIGSSPTDIPSDANTYAAGATIGGSVAAYSGTGTTFSDAGLSAGANYFYAVFSFNGNGGARNYNESGPLTGNFITLPNAPVAKPPSNPTSVSFTANWDAAFGATTYELDLSQDDFSTVVTTTDITGTEQSVNGLIPSTDYKYRVRAVNASGGKSANSNAITSRTSDPPANPLKINTSPSSAAFPATASSVKFTINVSGGSGDRTVTIKKKGILETDFESLPTIPKGGDNYETEVDSGMMDELGLEYYAEATDEAGTDVVQPSSSFLYRSIAASSMAIPFAPGFTGKTATYQMFSIPYELQQNDINRIFDVSLGGYDNTKWRLFHYEGGENKEYPKQFLEVKLGAGYWFNTILSDVQVKVGAATVAENNKDNPFQLFLAPKWNQIGNPYPFSIGWTDVAGSNDDVGDLNFWSTGKYSVRNVLKPWEGAFVFNSSSSPITLPISILAKTNGRLMNNDLPPELDKDAWKLTMTLSIDEFGVESGIGMHPEARSSKDKFDRISLPRLNEFVEMDVIHPEFFAPKFATDMIPPSQEHIWTFEISSSLTGERAELRWDYAAISQAKSSLILIDLLDNVWVDMKAQGSYSFVQKEGRQVRIMYRSQGEVLPGMTLVGGCYPNPFTQEVNIPLLLEKSNMSVTMHIYNLLGQRVKTISATFLDAGMQKLVWNGKDDQGTEVPGGVLLYRLDYEGTSQTNRMVKQ